MGTAQRVEVQAKTVEEAVRLALAQLNRRREEVQIEVLREPTGGIFGFGAEDAVVRVTALTPAVGEAADEDDEDDDEDEEDAEEDEEDYADEAEDEDYEDEEDYAEEYDETEEAGAALETAPAEDAATRQLEEAALDTLMQLLTRMGITARVAVRDRRQLYLAEGDPPTTALDIFGPNLGLLIGRKGETLAALQYLVNLMVNRQVGQWTRVLVDIEGYRRRREESLEGLAQRVAYRVAQSRRPVTLEPMPPNERRVIHMTLRDHPSVYTESSGEGDARKVTIIPRTSTR